MKVVVNCSYGGFSLLGEALKYVGVPYEKKYGIYFPKDFNWLSSYECRTNPKLIEFIEKFGSNRASGSCSELIIKEVPKGTLFRIEEYDGMEQIKTADSVDWWVAT